jgi:hypothetical protein
MRVDLPRVGVMALLLSTAGCFDFEPDVTPGPSELPPTRLTTVEVEYRQPNGCLNATGNCADRVVFFGSWMRSGEEVLLEPAPGRIWVGSVSNVPVNWPPVVLPHRVRVFDPHLVDTDTGGVSAERLKVGRQILTVFDEQGTPGESGRVYVDDNGIGHNPF